MTSDQRLDDVIDTGRTITTHEFGMDDFGDWCQLKSMSLVHFICVPIKVGELVGKRLAAL